MLAIVMILSTAPWTLAYSLQIFSPATIQISSQCLLAGYPKCLAPSVRLRVVRPHFRISMVGFGAGKATGAKKGTGKSGSGRSGSSHSSSSFPPAMLKKFKQLKEEGCSVAKVYARVRGDSLASPGAWYEVSFEKNRFLVGGYLQ